MCGILVLIFDPFCDLEACSLFDECGMVHNSVTETIISFPFENFELELGRSRGL